MLISAKVSDYILFKQCFEMIKQGLHLTEEGLLKIVGIKSSLNWGISENLKLAFPNAIPVKRPKYEFKGITEAFWVADFTSGDGSFNLNIKTPSTKKSPSVSLKFSINLNIRELNLIQGLSTFFLSPAIKVSETTNVTETEARGNYNNVYPSGQTVALQISNINTIINTIIPFFENYPLMGVKSYDFKDFKKVAYIVKNKDHLTPEGFNKILEIKWTMNQNRLY